jgi:hypothetical protein
MVKIFDRRKCDKHGFCSRNLVRSELELKGEIQWSLKQSQLARERASRVSLMVYCVCSMINDYILLNNFLQKVSQFMSRAARLNEAFSGVRRVPIIRPSLPAPGVTPWPAMSLR